MSNSKEFCFLCKDNFSLPKSKIEVLGKSALDIPSLILKPAKEDVNVYVERERFYICRMYCSVSIGSYCIKTLFVKLTKSVLISDDSVRVKRLAKEPGRLPEAKKSLKFGDTSSASATCEKSQHEVPCGQ